MQYNILNGLDESYFMIQREPIIDDYKCPQDLEEKNLNKFLEVYHNLKNDNNSYGSSYFMQDGFPFEKEFLRIFIIKYYDRGGHVILSAFFTNNKGEVGYTQDPQYKSDWEDFDFKIECERYKRLMCLSFNHVLPDGKIIEYVFDEKNLYDPFKNIEMFFEMVKVKKRYTEKEELAAELSINDHVKTVVKKI